VILGRVQRGEIVPVGLDLGAVGDFEADRAEQALDALERARHRMQATARFAATGQRDIQRLGGQLRASSAALRIASRRSLSAALDAVLGDVDRGTGLLRSSGGSLPSPSAAR
jgi:hypothetical protein